VAAINRAIAVAETKGASAALAALDACAGDARLKQYQPYWAARAGLLARAGEVDAAGKAYELAIGLESDPAVREFLQRRCEEVRRRPKKKSCKRIDRAAMPSALKIALPTDRKG